MSDNLFRGMGLYVLMVLSVTVGSLQGDCVSDDFSSGIDGEVYTAMAKPYNTVEARDGKVVFSGQDGTCDSRYCWNLLKTDYTLEGDFDVRIQYSDLDLPYPGSGKATFAGFWFYEEGYFSSVGRNRGFGGLDYYVAYPSPYWGRLDTTDMSGEIRMTRTSSTFRAYCGGDLVGTEVFTDGPVTFGFGLERNNHMLPASIAFDNLYIEADTIVPEPVTLSLLGLAGIALLRQRRQT